MILLAFAAVVAAASPAQQFADSVLASFASGDVAAFEAVYPFERGRNVVRDAVHYHRPLVRGIARVVHENGGKATLVLSGFCRTLNSGDDVVLSRAFSGLYDAEQDTGGNWKLIAQRSIDDRNRIHKQSLRVTVIPGARLHVVDELDLAVDASTGFIARLNPKVKIESIRWKGGRVPYAFGGALLWVGVRPASRGTLTVAYSIADIEEGPDATGAGCFLPRAGHLRNQYFWHPFFDFDTPNDRADFVVDARIPKAFQMTLSIPQTELVRGDWRWLHAVSDRPTMALTLAYARDWHPQSLERNGVVLRFYTADDFTPAAAEVAEVFAQTFAILRRFGSPRLQFIGFAQTESRAGGGWHFTSNDVIFTGGQGGGPPFRTEGYPRAFLSHEISHLWTAGAGPGMNLLQEGWARFVESLVFRQRFGDEVERRYWRAEAADYFQNSDGKATIIDDPENSGVAYTKGSWIFRMLDETMGEEAFDAGMRDFVANCQRTPQTIEQFTASMQKFSPSIDVAKFLKPWLSESKAPHIESRIDGSRIVLTQDGPVFILPLTIEIESSGEKRRQKIMMSERETTIDAGAAVRSAAIDPDDQVLLRR